EGADVKVGAIGVSITGLTFDGNRPRGGSGETNMVSLRYQLARFATVRSSTLEDGYHGGVIFERGTSDSVIEGNTFVDNGDPWDYGGSAIWLSQGAQRNFVRGNVISGRTFTGITIDDRTVHSSEYDAEGTNNLVENNTIDIPMFPPSRNAGVVMFGARENVVVNNNISHARTGVLVARSVQGTLASVARSNSVRDNVLIGHRVGINVSGSDNEFIRNEIRDAHRPWTNSGKRNSFVDNTVE
ncbi:MAG: right-handed parallel beta-helix repeat-containing protein, partial [Vicinamibacterales bacterium]